MRTLLLAILALPSAATAQETVSSGFNGHGFTLAPHDADPRDLMSFTRAGGFSAGDFYVGGVGTFANQPVVFQPDRNLDPIPALQNVAGVLLGGGYSAHERLRLELSLPVFFAASDSVGAIPAGLGDISVGVTGALIRPEGSGVGLAIVGNVNTPIGAQGTYLRASGLEGGGALAFTLETTKLTVSTNLGAQVRGQNTDLGGPTRGGSAMTYGVGLGYLLNDNMGINLESWGEVALNSDVRVAVGLPAQVMGSFRMRTDSGGHVSVGIGGGLTRGAGASPIRAMIGGGFGKVGNAGPKDADADGIVDKDDQCPEQPEVANGYLDDDGCPDERPFALFSVTDEAEQAQPEALITVTDPNGETLEQTGTLRVDHTEEGTEIQASAVLNGCLTGEATAKTGFPAGPTPIVVTPKRTATIRFEVTDGRGDPIKWSVAKYGTPEERCRPERAKPFKTGTGEHQVGAGEHVIFVSASNYSVKQVRLTLTAGETKDIKVSLDSKRVTVNEDGNVEFADPLTFKGDQKMLDVDGEKLTDELSAVVLQKGFTQVQITTTPALRWQGTEMKKRMIQAGVAEGMIVLKNTRDELTTPKVRASK